MAAESQSVALGRAFLMDLCYRASLLKDVELRVRDAVQRMLDESEESRDALAMATQLVREDVLAENGAAARADALFVAGATWGDERGAAGSVIRNLVGEWLSEFQARNLSISNPVTDTQCARYTIIRLAEEVCQSYRWDIPSPIGSSEVVWEPSPDRGPGPYDDLVASFPETRAFAAAMSKPWIDPNAELLPVATEHKRAHLQTPTMAAEILSLDEQRRQAMDLAVSCILGDIPLTARQTALLHTARDALLARPRAVVKLEAARTDAPTMMVAAAVAAAMHVLVSQRPVFGVSLEYMSSTATFKGYVHRFLVALARERDGPQFVLEDSEDKGDRRRTVLTTGRADGQRVLITDGREPPAEEPDTTILWITKAAN